MSKILFFQHIINIEITNKMVYIIIIIFYTQASKIWCVFYILSTT